MRRCDSSVANYFAVMAGNAVAVAVPAAVSGGGAGLAETTPKPSRTLGELANAGVRPQAG